MAGHDQSGDFLWRRKGRTALCLSCQTSSFTAEGMTLIVEQFRLMLRRFELSSVPMSSKSKFENLPLTVGFRPCVSEEKETIESPDSGVNLLVDCDNLR